MHPAKLAPAFTVVLLLAGCPDRDRNASIEAANKGVEAFNHESWEKATNLFQDAVKLYPGNHHAWYSLGQVYGKKNDWEKATEAFEAAVKHGKNDAMYYLWLGVARYEWEQTKLAEATKDKRSYNPSYGPAEEALQRAAELNGDLYRAHWYLGRIFRDTNRPKLAAEAWTRACLLNPYFGKPFVALGELYLRWDKVSEAIQVLSQGKQFVVDDEDLTNIYYYLGMSYDVEARANPDKGASRWDASIEAYSQAIDHRADNDQARFQRGLAYIAKGDRAKGQADLDLYVKRGRGTTFEKQEAMRAMYGAMASGPGLPMGPGATPP
jgi:tetratricopeptide (TPR) repeat protein